MKRNRFSHQSSQKELKQFNIFDEKWIDSCVSTQSSRSVYKLDQNRSMFCKYTFDTNTKLVLKWFHIFFLNPLIAQLQIQVRIPLYPCPENFMFTLYRTAGIQTRCLPPAYFKVTQKEAIWNKTEYLWLHTSHLKRSRPWMEKHSICKHRWSLKALMNWFKAFIFKNLRSTVLKGKIVWLQSLNLLTLLLVLIVN